MSEAGGSIGFYHQMFLFCLIPAVCGLALSLILFFALDVPKILSYLTGRRARKEMKELEEEAVRRAAENSTTVLSYQKGKEPGG